MLKGIIFDFNRTLFDPEKQRLLEGVNLLLPKLARNYKLALFSTGGDSREQLIKNLGIEKHFREILVVSEKGKLHLLSLAEGLNCRPEELLVVGDRVKSEVALAKSLGIKTVWLKKGRFASESPADQNEEPDFIIQELEDLPKILKQL